jgi:ABC-type lipoprotein release transport system permease subunit
MNLVFLDNQTMTTQVGATLLPGAIPARRASRVDPSVALRSE